MTCRAACSMRMACTGPGSQSQSCFWAAAGTLIVKGNPGLCQASDVCPSLCRTASSRT